MDGSDPGTGKHGDHRFWNHGHTPGEMFVRREGRNPDYPLTLDLRRAPEMVMEGVPGLPSELMQQEQQQQ